MRRDLPALLTGLLAASCASDRVPLPPPPPVDWQSLERQPPSDTSSEKATEKERKQKEGKGSTGQGRQGCCRNQISAQAAR